MAVNAGDPIKWYTYYTTSYTIRQQYANQNGIRAVWNNPNMYDGGESGNRPMRTPVPYSNRIRKNIININTPTQWNVASDLTILAADQNKIASDIIATGNIVQNLTGIGSGQSNAQSVVPGDTVLAEHLNRILNISTNIANILKQYDGWFDSDGVCSRSCQVTCQVGCQVTCQNCVNGLCHDQNCGTS